MTDKQAESKHILAAKGILERAKGHMLTPEQRINATVELAGHLLNASNLEQTRKEKKLQAELSRMMRDPTGKAFTLAMTDQCFRSKNYRRIADQMVYLLDLFGVPRFLSIGKRIPLMLFHLFGKKFPHLFVPLAMSFLRKETASVILPGEKGPLRKHIMKRKREGVRINLNHLGEAILGEKEALRRLDIYLNSLADEHVEYVSIKISTIYSQINLLAWEENLEVLSERLRTLYRAAMKNPFIRKDGSVGPKFVNLDMEEYRDLQLTKELFVKVLNEPEFKHFSAGIVLQSYLPDAYNYMKEITEWAMQRVDDGGASIKIRIVKGANMVMEQCESSLKDWPQAPYKTKDQTDANYKSMLHYGVKKEHARAVHLGIASHNLFDIAYAMILRSENEIENEISFEMLEGMADPTRRVVQSVVGDILLYCPVAAKKDFQHAIGYLIRRLDENTGIDNFLSHSFNLKVGTKEWHIQVAHFRDACKSIEKVSHVPRRFQNQNKPPVHLPYESEFKNESDTDIALKHNREWAEKIIATWKNKVIAPIPLVVNGEEILREEGEGFDPSNPEKALYRYTLGSWKEIDTALDTAKEAEETWGKTSFEKRCHLVSKACEKIREARADLIGCMVADGGKLVTEADVEVSEAVDMGEYYFRTLQELTSLPDVKWTPKGTVLVCPPWNFPAAIPVGGIFAALLAGNAVIFKPAPESVLVGWILVNLLWEAGISKKVVQFVNCEDDPVGSKLIKDPRLNVVILTGATSTARLFMKMRPGIDLSAETGGKNAMIITAMADRDLAIKDLIQSAFGHNGQKCSAASLAICEKEVYDDPHFMRQLKEAAQSLKVGTAWDFSSKITPLIHPPLPDLKKALTTLEQGEKWLLEPKQDPHNPALWSPGIKIGVKKNSYTHLTEFFGPVLGIMRAETLEDAIKTVNASSYGLTSGLQSLDAREIKAWEKNIVAGNCYINRSITGAVVRRQPFGGCKNSSFGHGSKAGGPNYLTQFMRAKQVGIPKEKFPVNDFVNNLSRILEDIELSAEELGIWYASIANYAHASKHFKKKYDPSKIVGEDNYFKYVKQQKMYLRIGPDDKPLDYLRCFAAALTCGTPLQVSWETKKGMKKINWQTLLPIFNLTYEAEDAFMERVKNENIKRIRLVSSPSEELKNLASELGCYLDTDPVLANGRIELLHYLREVSLSVAYHRYGNLGIREGEIRHPVK